MNQAAAVRGIPSDILETQVDVDRRRKAVPPSYYATVLAAAFAPDVEDKYQALVEALNIGDYDAAFEASQADPRVVEDVETFNRLMLLERNKAWLAPLQRYLDEGNAVIVVGAAHLPGDGGLLELLQGRGYMVKHIHVDANQ
nr:TraB/GumN family protein [Achromobacter xylosoxidans]